MNIKNIVNPIKKVFKVIDKILRFVPIIIVKIYRLTLSRIFPNTCRFYPSCSEYSLEAFKKYNFFKASYLSSYRILRCNPFNPGGYDPLK